MVINKATVVMENWKIPLTPRVELGYSGENDVCEFEVITEPQEGFTYYLELQPLIEEANNILLTPDYVEGRIYVELTTEMLGSGGVKKAQIVAYIDTEDAPIKKSNVFEVEVDSSINATKSVESHYQTALSQWAQILASFNPQEVLAKLQEVEADVDDLEEGINYITDLACRLYKFNSPTPQTNPAFYPGIRNGDLTFASGDLYFAQGVTEQAITWKKLSGGGGGGTDDYNDLDNKPQINSVELSGNKTASDLGLVVPSDLAGYPTIYVSRGVPSTDPTDFPGIKDKDICVDTYDFPNLYRIYVANMFDEYLTWIPCENKTYTSRSNPPVSASDQAGIKIGDIWIKFSGPSLSPNQTIYINTGISNSIYWWVNMSEGKLPTSSAADEGKILKVNASGNAEWANNTDITTDTSSTTASITLANNSEYRYTQELSSITLTLPQSPAADYISGLVFGSGTTPTAMTYDSSIKWSGDDVTSNAFVPVASKTYNIVFWFDGININAVARGV